MEFDRHVMGERIAARLVAERPRLQADYGAGRVPAFCLDDLLPPEWAAQLHAVFPAQRRMTFKNSIKERKHVTAQMNAHAPILEEAVYAFQMPAVVEAVAAITGLKGLEPDTELYAGGLSAMGKGAYLKPHLDNSHDAAQQRYRVLNLLYYVTPDWRAEDGGALEVWDEGPTGTPRAFPSLFNRLVVMATNRHSWHSVDAVKADRRRCCVSNYYFSRVSPEERDYFHATSFRGRPDEPIGDLIMRADATLRTVILKTTGTKLYKNPHRYHRD